MICVSKRLVYFFILMTIFSSCGKRPKLDASKVFKQFIINPIPESVKDINAAQPRSTGGYTYILKFNISRNDLNKIIESKPFERVWNVCYSINQIVWSWDFNYPGSCLLHFNDSLPKWFSPEIPKEFDAGLEIIDEKGEISLMLKRDPNTSGHSEAYAFSIQGGKINKQIQDTPKLRGAMDTMVILYNNNKSEAYFIVTRIWE